MNTFKICCICKKKYAGFGHNAQPVKHGFCCGDCNILKVIPARLKLLKGGWK